MGKIKTSTAGDVPTTTPTAASIARAVLGFTAAKYGTQHSDRRQNRDVFISESGALLKILAANSWFVQSCLVIKTCGRKMLLVKVWYSHCEYKRMNARGEKTRPDGGHSNSNHAQPKTAASVIRAGS